MPWTWTAGGRRLILPVLAVLGFAAAGRDLRLVEAAKNGEWNAVRALLTQGADVTEPEGDGATALHWAAYWDNAGSADLLIRAGAKVNATTDLGVTPLWMACENGSADIVGRLLQAGANPNVALLSGETPLMIAARTGNAEVVRQLLAKGAEVNAKERARSQTALMWAVSQQHSDIVEVLLSHGANVHLRSNVWSQTVKIRSESAPPPEYIVDIQQGGYTPLLFAARVGDLASAKLLVAAGADVNDTAPYGTSATVVAAHSGHGDVAAFLLEKGADPNAARAGYSALHAAIMQRDERLVRILLTHGANPNAAVLHSTPARRASTDVSLQPFLVGATPFWLAARYAAPRIMRVMAEHGADPFFVHYLKWWRGGGAGNTAVERVEGSTTALMAAAGMGDRLVGGERNETLTLEAVKVAAELGIDVNAANADGDTALHMVSVRAYDSVVKFLVDHGARLDVKNKKGQTPLAAAIARAGGPGPGSEASPPKSTVELLRKLGAKE